MKRLYKTFTKGVGNRLSSVAAIIICGVLLATNAMADCNGWFETWNMKYYTSDYGGSDRWLPSRKSLNEEVELGIFPNDLYFKGAAIDANSDDCFDKTEVNIKYDIKNGCSAYCTENYTVERKDKPKGSVGFEYTGWNANLSEKVGRIPGRYKVELQFVLSQVVTGRDNFYFVIPGFTSQNTQSLSFGGISQGKSSGAKYVTYKHYGTALTASNCTIKDGSGSDVDYFEITEITESKVSVKFTPKNTTPLGDVTAYLNITDANSKKINQVTLKGTVKAGTVVLAGSDADVSNGPSVILHGYLQYGECLDTYTKYGFYYTSSGCASVTSSTTSINVSGDAKYAGGTWDCQITSGLSTYTTYYYKPYVEDEDTDTKVFSTDCYTFTTGDVCTYPAGDTIYYHVDASLEFENLCELKFKSIENALADLKTHVGNNGDAWWDNSGRMLKTNIVFEVAEGTYGVSNTLLDLKSINPLSNSKTPTKRFVIRGESESTKPTIYGVNMSGSRLITLKNLILERTTTGTGLSESAVIIGFEDQVNNRSVGEMTNTDIEFINCDINAQAFCCIHGNGVNGLYMTGCNLKAMRDPNAVDPKNDMNWGSSLKLMNSKNVRLVRNNFRGSHGTNIFLQNSEYVQIMNNAFWNDNGIKRENNSEWNYKSFIRLIKYSANGSFNKVNHIGIYYNTMYLKNNSTSGYNDRTDFLVLGGQASGNPAQTHTADHYDFNTIDFMYNNCYSYDADIPGRTTDAFCNQTITSSDHIKNNNFWSDYGSHDGFNFGSGVRNINIHSLVCVTAPDTPEGLVIKGDGLNYGSAIANDISGFKADTVRSDRLHYKVRPENSVRWTYGAYQQGISETAVDRIFWKGGAEGDESNWDNRNNWLKANGEQLTCIDELAEDLTAVIPAPTESKVAPRKYTISHYPDIATWSTPASDEYVRAGISTETREEVSLYAKNIEMEYGAALLGVENLKETDGAGNPIYRYNTASNSLTVKKKEWVLVGTVIRWFNNPGLESDSTTRLVQSGDFYMNQEPQVYMQQVTTTGTGGSTKITWGIPFADTYTPVPSNKCFAIYVANQYGPKKRTAKMFYPKGDPRRENGDKDESVYFYGHFAAENVAPGSKPSFSFKEGYNFVNNFYPANVYASAFYVTSLNSVKVYDYPDRTDDDKIAGAGGWDDYASISVDYEIKPQNGFVVVAESDNVVELEDEDFTHNSTKYRRAPVMTGVTLAATNVAVNKGSRVSVWQDYSSIEKAENGEDEQVCEVYIPTEKKNLSTLSLSELDAEVPIGIHNKMSRSMTVKFTLTQSPGMESVVLEDRSQNPVATYDLLQGETPYFAEIPVGYTEGRFFLVLNGGPEGGGLGPTTDTEDSGFNDGGIEAFINSNTLTVSVSANQSIESIRISDMSGRTWSLTPNGKNLSNHLLPVANGTYIVSIVTDMGSARKKIIIRK